jgi:hypothetical protein
MRADLATTLTAIDKAIGCQHCGRALDQSPSPDFCSEDCQQEWHQRRIGTAPDERRRSGDEFWYRKLWESGRIRAPVPDRFHRSRA